MPISQLLDSLIQEAITLSGAAKHELTQNIFDSVALKLQTSPQIAALSKSGGINLAQILTPVVVIASALSFLRERLVETVKGTKMGAKLSQVEAFEGVDIWGRVTGVCALASQIGSELDSVASGNTALNAALARVGVFYELANDVTLSLAQGSAKVGALSVMGERFDRLIALIDAERRGIPGAKLSDHLANLPA